MIPDPAVLICNDRLGDVLKDGMEDALGRTAAEAVFSRAGLACFYQTSLKQTDLSSLLKAMQELFGPRSGQGMAISS